MWNKTEFDLKKIQVQCKNAGNDLTIIEWNGATKPAKATCNKCKSLINTTRGSNLYLIDKNTGLPRKKCSCMKVSREIDINDAQIKTIEVGNDLMITKWSNASSPAQAICNKCGELITVEKGERFYGKTRRNRKVCSCERKNELLSEAQDKCNKIGNDITIIEWNGVFGSAKAICNKCNAQVNTRRGSCFYTLNPTSGLPGKKCKCTSTRQISIEKANERCNKVGNNVTIIEWNGVDNPATAICNKCGKKISTSIGYMFYKYKDGYLGKQCECSKFTNIEKAQSQCNDVGNDITIVKWENTLSPAEAICNKCNKIVYAAQGWYYFVIDKNRNRPYRECSCTFDRVVDITDAQLACDSINAGLKIIEWNGAISLAKAQCTSCKEILITYEGRNFYKLTKYGIPQKICSCKYDNSRIETHVSNILKQNYTVSRTVKFDDLVGVGNGKLSYDIGLINDDKSYHALIEVQGPQHYGPVDRFGGEEKFKIQVEHDKRKREYASKIGIELIEIPFWEFHRVEDYLEELGFSVY